MTVRLVVGWLAELALLSVAVVWISRKLSPRFVVLVTAVSFSLRMLVGQGLFAISILHLPLLRDLQLRNGLWIFGHDAAIYDEEARNLVAILHGAQALPPSFPFSWLVGVDYYIFGARAAQGIMLGAAAAAACIPLTYWIAHRTGVPPLGQMIAVLLVGFWPSSFIWSGQLVKDPLEWLALLAIFAGLTLLMTTDGSLAARARPVRGGAIAIFLGALVTGWLRGTLVSPVLTLTMVIVGALWLIPAFRVRCRWSPIGLAALMVIAGSMPSFFVNAKFMKTTVQLSATAATEIVQQSAGDSAPGQDHVHEDCPPARILKQERQAFIGFGGSTLVDADKQFPSCLDFLTYAPRAVELALFTPFPRDWFVSEGEVHQMRYFAPLDVILLFLAAPLLLAGMIGSFTRRSRPSMALAIYCAILIPLLGIIVPNYGTLFRLRLLAVYPAAILIGSGCCVALSWFRRATPRRLSFGFDGLLSQQ